MAAWTLARDAEEVARLLQEAGISAMAVMTARTCARTSTSTARGALLTLQHAEMGEERHSGDPLRLSRTPLATPRPAPLLGEHTADVLDALARHRRAGGGGDGGVRRLLLSFLGRARC